MAAALLVAGGLAVAGAAQAYPVPQNGANGKLSLDATPWPLGVHELAPGDSVRWQITAKVNQPGHTQLFLHVVGHGVMALDPAGVQLTVAWCPVAWSVPSDPALPASCSGGDERTTMATTPIATIPTANHSLGTISPAAPSHLLVTASLPPTAGTRFVNDAGSVDLVFEAAGDAQTLQVGGTDTTGGTTGRLASTGSLIAGPAMLAAGLLLAGLLLSTIRARRARGGRGDARETGS